MGIAAQIRDLLPLSFTYAEIAKTLSVTKGVIAGQVSRMRARGELEGHNRPDIMRVSPEDPVARMIVDFERFTMKVSATNDPVPQPPGCDAKHLLDLKPKDCRFIVARYSAGHFYCAQPRKSVTSSYCEQHHLVVFTPPLKKVKGTIPDRKGGWDRPYKIGEAR